MGERTAGRSISQSKGPVAVNVAEQDGWSRKSGQGSIREKNRDIRFVDVTRLAFAPGEMGCPG